MLEAVATLSVHHSLRQGLTKASTHTAMLDHVTPSDSGVPERWDHCPQEDAGSSQLGPHSQRSVHSCSSTG